MSRTVGHPVGVFCWPFTSCPESVRIAPRIFWSFELESSPSFDRAGKTSSARLEYVTSLSWLRNTVTILATAAELKVKDSSLPFNSSQ